MEGDLTTETHIPLSNLDRVDHFGPFHGSNRRRKSKKMMTLDPNYFGFQRAAGAAREEKEEGGGGQRGERRVGEIVKEEKKVPNPGPTSVMVRWVGRCKARANLNVGELDFEYATGTHKGSYRRRGGSKPGPT